MTDAPETMWRETISPSKMYPEGGSFYHETPTKKPTTEYRRASLPATNAQANENENVKVLVGLLEYLNQAGSLGLGKHQLIRAALATLENNGATPA